MIMLWKNEAAKYGANIHRVQVWDALSEFYLDSSHDKNDLERIANVLAQSPFSIEELIHIAKVEVDPACSSNLSFFGAWEWAMFHPDDLIPKCLKNQRKTPFGMAPKKQGIFATIASQLSTSYVPVKRVQEIRAELANLPPLAEERLHTVYVPLLNEGTPCFRPVDATHCHGRVYIIKSENKAPDDEEWQFSCGDKVNCYVHNFGDRESNLVAYEKVD